MAGAQRQEPASNPTLAQHRVHGMKIERQSQMPQRQHPLSFIVSSHSSRQPISYPLRAGDSNPVRSSVTVQPLKGSSSSNNTQGAFPIFPFKKIKLWDVLENKNSWMHSVKSYLRWNRKQRQIFWQLFGLKKIMLAILQRKIADSYVPVYKHTNR